MILVQDDLTEIGPLQIELPRDVDATFMPRIVKRRQRRPGDRAER